MHPSKDPHVVMSSMETSQVLAFLQALSRVCSVPRAQYAVASFAPGSAAPSGGSAELCPRLEDLLSIAREGSSLQVMEAEDPFNENFACVDGLRYSEAQAVRLFLVELAPLAALIFVVAAWQPHAGRPTYGVWSVAIALRLSKSRC